MKPIIIFIILLIFSSCEPNAQYMQYYRDARTGVCFAVTGASMNTATCVPCDSLKHVTIKPLKTD